MRKMTGRNIDGAIEKEMVRNIIDGKKGGKENMAGRKTDKGIGKLTWERNLDGRREKESCARWQEGT